MRVWFHVGGMAQEEEQNGPDAGSVLPARRPEDMPRQAVFDTTTDLVLLSGCELQ